MAIAWRPVDRDTGIHQALAQRVDVVDGEGEMVANLVGNCSSLTTYRFLTRTVAQAESRDSAENRKVVLN